MRLDHHQHCIVHVTCSVIISSEKNQDKIPGVKMTSGNVKFTVGQPMLAMKNLTIFNLLRAGRDFVHCTFYQSLRLKKSFNIPFMSALCEYISQLSFFCLPTNKSALDLQLSSADPQDSLLRLVPGVVI